MAVSSENWIQTLMDASLNNRVKQMAVNVKTSSRNSKCTYLPVIVQCVVSNDCCCDNGWMRWAWIDRQAKSSNQLNREVTRRHGFRDHSKIGTSKHTVPLTRYHLYKESQNEEPRRNLSLTTV